jgi:unspecific monooxygenase
MSNLPPSPSLSPFRQLIKWILDPVQFMEQEAALWGDAFTFVLSRNRPLVFTSNPADIQRIFQNDAAFGLGKSNDLLRPLVGDFSLLLMEGKRHRRERKLLMPPFHGERMKSYGTLILDVARQGLQAVPQRQTVKMRSLMQSVTLDVMMQVVFGVQDQARSHQIKPLLIEMLAIGASPLKSSAIFLQFLQQDLGAWSPWGKFLRSRHILYDLLQAEIEERRHNADPERTDILTLMLAIRDEAGNPMSDAEIKDELVTLLFAGHETSATVLAWGSFWLAKRPEMSDRIRQEMRELGDHPDPAAITRLPYLSAFCDEVLRMYPVVPITFPRRTLEEFAIADYTLPPDTSFAPCIYLLHRRPDLYPNPHIFQPERFCDRTYGPHEYIPFGGGARRCLGYALALYEIKLILALLATEHQLDLVDRDPPRIARRGLTLAPHNGVLMQLCDRSAPVLQSVSA